MEILIKASQFIISLSLLIVLHELGHFIPAKLFKTKVEKFYLFFDYKFSLFKKKVGETVYGIGWIPLGGYVKIAGMIDESMDKEQMKQEPKPWEFRSKPAWQRLIIMLGGVIVNFVLGWFIYVAVTGFYGDRKVKPEGVKNGFAVAEGMKQFGFQNGDKILKINGETPEDVTEINKLLFLRDVSSVEVTHLNGTTETLQIPDSIGSFMWKNGLLKPFAPRSSTPIIDSVMAKSPALEAGILKGDKILAVNGENVTYGSEFTYKVQSAKDKIALKVDRNGTPMDLNVKLNDDNKIGVVVKVDKNEIKNNIESYIKKYSFVESLSAGTSKAWWTLKDYITQFKYVFTKKGAQSIGGFIAIGNIFPSSWSWEAFWNITAFLSIMLGFMNLLPIPALDGGHVLFVLWEMITGRKPSDKFLEYAQITGFIILMALLLLANGNDVIKLFT